MGILNNIFGKKKTFAGAIERTQGNIFPLYRVAEPTDAQKMRASFRLCVAGMAILNECGAATKRPDLIDRLVEETKELTKPLSMPLGELAINDIELEIMLAEFHEVPGINKNTILNGLAAMDAMYFSQGEILMNDILDHRDGPFGGTAAYASIVIGDRIFGPGKSTDHFLELSEAVIAFAKELGEAI
jgi:hypothetical protein